MILNEQIRAIERRYHAPSGATTWLQENDQPFIATGWPAIDSVLGGGMRRNALHEWLGVMESAASVHGRWSPPIGLLTHLAWRAIDAARTGSCIVWVGAACFPYGSALVREAGTDRRLLENSIFVHADERSARLWAVDLALRSSAVAAVVADVSRFRMAESRRVQLLAQTHCKPAFCTRPPAERIELSAAQTRWLLGFAASNEAAARWNVELLRCKGVQPAHCPHWVLERDRASGAIGLSAALADPTIRTANRSA